MVLIPRFLKLMATVCLVVGMCTQSFAQNASTAAQPGGGGPRKQLATILFAGLGGAVLGLSTLSFYGRPQDKLSNIAIGFAFGVIVGTTFVTYKAATNPSEIYGLEPLKRHDEIGREKWIAASGGTPLGMSWNFEF